VPIRSRQSEGLERPVAPDQLVLSGNRMAVNRPRASAEQWRPSPSSRHTVHVTVSFEPVLRNHDQIPVGLETVATATPPGWVVHVDVGVHHCQCLMS